MYNLFKVLKWNPRKYFDADSGEKTVIRAFLYKLIEEKEEELREIENSYPD
jgi:hypothetical protein